MRAESFGCLLGLVLRHMLQSASEHYRLARDWAAAGDTLSRADADLRGEVLNETPVVRLAEVFGQRIDDSSTDSVDRVHMTARCPVARGELHARRLEGHAGAVGARQPSCGGVTDLANAERIDKALEGNAAA